LLVVVGLVHKLPSVGVSGGTLASAVASIESTRIRDMQNPFLLVPADKKPKNRSPIDSVQVWSHFCNDAMHS
jgi:hypothetical protein